MPQADDEDVVAVGLVDDQMRLVGMNSHGRVKFDPLPGAPWILGKEGKDPVETRQVAIGLRLPNIEQLCLSL